MDSTTFDLNPFIVLTASLILVGAAIITSWWLKLGVEKSIVVAAVRAAVQLIAVGVLLTVVIDSEWEKLLAPLWILAMVGIAGYVVTRRTGTTQVLPAALAAIGASTTVSLAVVFGLGVLPAEPIQMIVIAGITIGNVMPATVLGADQITRQLTEGRPVIEGLLALGVDSGRSTRFMVAEATRVAILPQIERTKVVGLIALPGAFTGLLLAGVAPLDAAVIQLVVMYLVLGSVAVSSSTIAFVTARKAFTPDQRLIEV